MIYGPKNPKGQRGDGGDLTPVVRIFEGTFDVDTAPSVSLKDIIPYMRPLYLCDACNPNVYISSEMTIQDLIRDASDMSDILLIARSDSSAVMASPVSKIRRIPRTRLKIDSSEEVQENPIKLDGTHDKQKRMSIWYKRGQKLCDETEYHPQTGLFVKTPVPTIHGTTLPGMGIVQEGDSTTAREGVVPCVAVCLVRVRVKSAHHNQGQGDDSSDGQTGEWINKRCSDKVYVGLKAIKQHTSVHGHREALKRQGANDAKHYVLECDSCPRAQGTGYLKGQASWPWTHQHTSRSSNTTTQLTITSPSQEEAKPFLPVLESSTKARVVPWMQSICGYQETMFPANSVFPEHIMRLYCMLYENTRAVVFAFSGDVPLGMAPDVYNKYVCPHKFNLGDADDDADIFYHLMCVPCNDVPSFVAFADKMEHLSMGKRLEAALAQIALFDPHSDVSDIPQFQGVLMVDQPLEHTFRIPDPKATRPFVPRKQLSIMNKKKKKKKRMTYDDLKRNLGKISHKHKNKMDDTPQSRPKAQPMEIINALAPPNNKYQSMHHKQSEAPARKKSKKKKNVKEAAPPVDDMPAIVSAVGNALRIADESNLIREENYYMSVAKTLEKTCATTFTVQQEDDNLVDFLAQSGIHEKESTFYETHVRPVLAKYKASPKMTHFVEHIVGYTLERLRLYFKQDHVDGLFQKDAQPTEEQIYDFVKSVLRYWKAIINQALHAFKVQQTYEEARNTSKRLNGKVIMVDHPLHQPRKTLVDEEDHSSEERSSSSSSSDEERSAEDTYSSSSDEDEGGLWETLQKEKSASQERSADDEAPSIVNPDAWKVPTDVLAIWKPSQEISLTSVEEELWTKTLRKSQENLALEQQQQQYVELQQQKLREREQKMREHQNNLRRARQQEEDQARRHEEIKRRKLSDQRDEERKRAHEELLAQQRTIELNELDNTIPMDIPLDDICDDDFSLLSMLREEHVE